MERMRLVRDDIASKVSTLVAEPPGAERHTSGGAPGVQQPRTERHASTHERLSPRPSPSHHQRHGQQVDLIGLAGPDRLTA